MEQRQVRDSGVTETPSTGASTPTRFESSRVFSAKEQQDMIHGLDEGLQFRMYSIFRDVSHERMVQIFRRGVLQPQDLFTLVAEAEDRHVRVYDLIQAIVQSYRVKDTKLAMPG